MPLSSVVGAQSIVKPGVCTSSTRPASPYDGQVIYMTDVDQTAVWDGTTWVVIAPIAGGRNKIINGGMSVWQRGTSFADPVNMTGYTADRWAAVWGATGRTFSRQAGFANSQYCLRVQRNSGSTGTSLSGIAQIFETVNSVPLQGKNVTLSFNARCGANFSSTSNRIGVTLYTGTGTDQTGSTFYFSGLTGQVGVINSNATLSTTSQRFTFTGSIPSNATQIVIYIYFTPTGTAGAADHFEITNVQLEEGAVATPFEFEDYGTTLAKCQRYYQKAYNDATYAGNSGVAVGGFWTYAYAAIPNGVIYYSFLFPTRMRVTPTVYIYSYEGQQNRVHASGIGEMGANTAVPAQIGNASCAVLNNSGSTMPSGYLYLGFYVASAEL